YPQPGSACRLVEPPAQSPDGTTRDLQATVREMAAFLGVALPRAFRRSVATAPPGRPAHRTSGRPFHRPAAHMTSPLGFWGAAYGLGGAVLRLLGGIARRQHDQGVRALDLLTHPQAASQTRMPGAQFPRPKASTWVSGSPGRERRCREEAAVNSDLFARAQA